MDELQNEQETNELNVNLIEIPTPPSPTSSGAGRK